MDDAAPLRRAAQSRHELQLVGPVRGRHARLPHATKQIVGKLGQSDDPRSANQLYSAFAAGAGIVGRGSSKRYPPSPKWLTIDYWGLANPDDVNGGTNHFGSPFNFPEEFIAVYRLHALLPDMIEFRDVADANAIASACR